jgi:D-arginine dehydrogenase
MTSLDADFDFAVIGAGIVGASIAFHLTRAAPAARVLLLEAESAAGYHTTGRSAALYSSGYGPPQVRALTRASRGFFHSPPMGFSPIPLWRARGALFAGTEDQLAAAEALQAELISNGVASERLGRDEVMRLLPVLRPEAAAVGIRVADDFDLEVDALLQGFLRGARSAGAVFVRDARVQALVREAAGWRVETASGTFRARHIVDAAGAWADAVAGLAGVPTVGLEPRRRTAFTFVPPEGLATAHWPAVVALDESWYLKPDAGWLLGSPANADPTHPHDVLPEELDVALGIHRIEAATTLTIRRPRSTWAGLRCFVADGEPVCGWATAEGASHGFFWAAALGGYGIQSAPAFGRLCAARLLGHDLPDDLTAEGLDLTALRPDRPGLTRTASEP